MQVSNNISISKQDISKESFSKVMSIQTDECTATIYYNEPSQEIKDCFNKEYAKLLIRKAHEMDLDE